MNSGKLYNIGIIGAGMIARQHLDHLQNTGRVQLSWIAATKPDNLEQVRSEFNIEKKTLDYRDILNDPGVDAILITTPPHLHKEMFIQTMEAGKHVLLEKPMAIRTSDLEKMIEVAGKFPNQIAMDCSGRHSRLNPKFRKVKQMVDSGMLGEVYRVHHQSVARQGRPGIEFHPGAKWFLDRSKAGGGPVFDWGVYDLSFHLGVLGDKHELEEIQSAQFKNGLDNTDPGTDVYNVEEHFNVALRLTNNVIYTWERGAHANVEVPNETRIYGTRGGLKLAYCTWDDPTITSYGFDSKGKASEDMITVDMRDHPNDGFALVDHFLRVLDGDEPPVISLELAKKHMDIIHKCAHFADISL